MSPPSPSRPRIAVTDYGMGNLRSAQKALEHVGAAPEVTRDHARVKAADGIVLPGVGAFPKAMEAVRRLGLDELIRERAADGVPLLGICLGMQLLFDASVELGGARGLGLLSGRVEALEAPGLKVPHIGWNPVAWRRDTTLVRGLPDPCAFYHVHSYAPRIAGGDPAVREGGGGVDAGDVLGTAVHGTEFVSAVERGAVYGVQFHPEKSGPDGLALLGNFARICRERNGSAGAKVETEAPGGRETGARGRTAA